MNKGDLLVCVSVTKDIYDFMPIVGELYIVLYDQFKRDEWVYTSALGRYDRDKDMSFKEYDFKVIEKGKLFKLIRMPEYD